MLNHLAIWDTVRQHGHVSAVEHAVTSLESIWVHERCLTLHMGMGADEVLRREWLFIKRHGISCHHAWSRGWQGIRGKAV